MDLMKLGTQMLLSKVVGANASSATSALAGLLGSKAEGESSGPDIGGLIAKMQGNDTGNDLTELAASWLGKGDNSPVSTDQLKSMFGSEKLSQFASQLGTDEETAMDGLKDALPNLIDKASPDGNILDSLGGLSGLASMGAKFLKK